MNTCRKLVIVLKSRDSKLEVKLSVHRQMQFGTIAKSVASAVTSRPPPLRESRETPSSRQSLKIKNYRNIESHQVFVDKVINMSSRPELKVISYQNPPSNATLSNFR
jgi:hypothetical protein